MLCSFLLHALSVPAVLAGTVLWDGRFKDLASSADLTKWSFESRVGPYQYYIHGDSPVDKYINLDATHKNPSDAASKQGARFTIDNTSYWHGQNMRRTELIPQSSAAINKGQVYYHFSVKRTATNAPDPKLEHQVCFFESHFTELKYGGSVSDGGGTDLLRWAVGGQPRWNATLGADVWHNVAYAIDFDAKTVALWHSTGGDALQEAVSAQTAATSSVRTGLPYCVPDFGGEGPLLTVTFKDGADWHLGVLRLPDTSGGGGGSGADTSGPEDWYFSGVYIENGPLTTSVSGPAAGGATGDSSGSGPAANGTTSDTGAGSGSSASGDTANMGGASSSSSSSAAPSTTLVTSTSTVAVTFATPSSPPAAPSGNSGSGNSGSGDGTSGGSSTDPGSGGGASSGGSTGGSSSSGGSSSGGGDANGGYGKKLATETDAVRVAQQILEWIQQG